MLTFPLLPNYPSHTVNVVFGLPLYQSVEFDLMCNVIWQIEPKELIRKKKSKLILENP